MYVLVLYSHILWCVCSMWTCGLGVKRIFIKFPVVPYSARTRVPRLEWHYCTGEHYGMLPVNGQQTVPRLQTLQRGTASLFNEIKPPS